jgi:hypothetical protein
MRNRALKFTLGFVIVGLGILILISVVQRGAINAYHNNLPYVRLSDHLKNQVAQSNLWVEHVKRVDPRLNYERDVREPLSKCKVLLESMYDGKETDLGTFDKADDEDLKAILKENIYNIQNLLESTQARWQAKPQIIAAATDSTAEVIDTQSFNVLNLQVDASLKDFQRVSERLINHIDQEILGSTATLNVLSWISIFGLVIALVSLGFFLYRLFERSDKLQVERAAIAERQEKGATALSNFMEAISAGNYSANLDDELVSGTMGNTLTSMRDKLKANAEEDRKRNWSTSGLAQIGELLRTSFTTTQDLFDSIIKFVVKYTKSNQGGLFLLNEENANQRFLELVACYAYERKKFLNKQIDVGEGLVGQSFLEAQSIYLVEIPEDYVAITSSLGGAKPNALLVMPLKVNGKVFGILELATFGKYEPHEIELVEKLAESIASTISTVRINDSTRILLEKTQQQTEEMRARKKRCARIWKSSKQPRRKCGEKKSIFKTCSTVKRNAMRSAIKTGRR